MDPHDDDNVAAAAAAGGGGAAAAAPPMSPGAVAAAAVADAADAAEHSRRRLEDELQCVLCHDSLFKPVTSPCGHSFCRVCLLDSCLSRAVAEAQCPVCRADVLSHLSASAPVALNVNVTLWNVIQLLAPTVEHRDNQQEEDEFAQKLDTLAARWKVHALQSATGQRLASRFMTAQFDDDDEDDGDYVDGEEDEGDEHGDDDWNTPAWGWDSEDDLDEGDSSADRVARWGMTLEERQRLRRRRQHQRQRERERQIRYPELKVENTLDGRLRVARNVVLDTDDANEDGLQTMRVGLALVDFPSVVELYTEHQECTLAVLKMEEDEEISTGFPFFMSESGDDDALIVSNYYNHVTLKVFDDGGNNVLERTRAAQQGIVDFPGLRLDVPAGLYTFHFSDDMYGMYLTVKTVLRELDEMSDAPFQDESHSSYVLDEAAENDRSLGRQRRRVWTASDEEDANLAEDDGASDDSFIVNDEEDEEGGGQGEEATAAFSDEEGEWEARSDDEEAEEVAARRWRERRRQRQANPRTAWTDEDQDVADVHGSGSEAGGAERRAVGNSVIELDSQDTDGHGVVGDDDGDEDNDRHQQVANAQRRNNRNRVVIESDDEDDDGDAPRAGAGREQAIHDGVDLEPPSEGAAVHGDEGEADDVYEDAAEEGGDNDPPSASRAASVATVGTVVHADNAERDDSDVDDSTRPPSDAETVRRSLKRRAANVLLSDDDDDDEEGGDAAEVDTNATKRLKFPKRAVYFTPHFSSDDDDDDGDNVSNEDDGDAKAARLHPWREEEQDALHEAQQAEADEEEEREDAEHEYGDDPGEGQSSDDGEQEGDGLDNFSSHDGWDQEDADDEVSGGEYRGEYDDEYGDADDGWH